MVTNSLNILENTINNTPKLFGYPEGSNGPGSLSTESQHEITNGMHQLETLLGALIDKNFDKFEIYVLRNVLAIPEGLVGWIRLSHHKVHFLPIRNPIRLTIPLRVSNSNPILLMPLAAVTAQPFQTKVSVGIIQPTPQTKLSLASGRS